MQRLWLLHMNHYLQMMITSRITNDGAASLELDEDTKKATITVKDNVKWSDGVDVTADDVIFPYEIIGNPEYTGIRYDDTFRNIVGMEEYNRW